MHTMKYLIFVLALSCSALLNGGCVFANAAGVMAYNMELEKKIEVLAEYDGLRNETVAVLVHADHLILYEHPKLVANVAVNVGRRIQQNVEGVKVLDPSITLDWTYHTPGWVGMPHSEIIDELGVDRLVWVEIYEFRLHPPGNRWIWEGMATATVGIVEGDGFDPDSFSEHWDISDEFPKIKQLGRESATQQSIETGLMAVFVRKIAWIFYDHIEEKYPDK